MSRTSWRRPILISPLILALLVLPALAQDASQVLRLSVGYRTLKNSVTLSEERKKEVEALEAEARKAAGAGQYGDALRCYYHAIALLRGQKWTPEVALAQALQAKPAQVVYDPGDAVRLKVTQSFRLTEPVAEKLSGTLSIAGPQRGRSEPIAELQKIAEVAPDFTAAPLSLDARLPQLPDGAYQLVVTLKPATGEPVVKTAMIRIARGLRARAVALKARSAELGKRFEGEKRADLSRALAAVEYAAHLIELLDAGEMPVERTDIEGEMKTAEARLEMIAKGTHPLKTARGDQRWAYRSTVDQTLQPYRLFIPSSYDAAKKYPLVVALHGMGGDENSYFSGYQNGVIKREAEARGYLVVCPKGRAPASMYLGNAEKDVLDVIAEMKRDFSIDEERIYLTGHSMGGYGTWSIAVNHPQMFAAIAPVAGGGMPATVARIAAIAHIPEIVVHGDADPTVPVDESRKMVRAAQAAGAKVKYIEVKGGNHSDIVVPHMKDIFDWFDAHRRQPKR